MAVNLTSSQKLFGVSASVFSSAVLFSLLIVFTFPNVKPAEGSAQKLDLASIAGATQFSSVAVASPFPAFNPESLNSMTKGVVTAMPSVPGSPMASNYTGRVPSVPVVPSMPGSPAGAAGAGSVSDKLTVIGVLPPNVVILQKGTSTVTAKAGTDTSLGEVGRVTKNGAYINGSFVGLKR
jgi:hypothetical protein